MDRRPGHPAPRDPNEGGAPAPSARARGASDSDRPGADLGAVPATDAPPEAVWQAIGPHRPIAGFFYRLVLYLLVLVGGIAFITAFLGWLYPFPESLGYKTAATGLFVLFFTLFDVGTANVMNRFLGEKGVTDPREMLHYVQYFVWYQMFTGLVQTTVVSLYALLVVPQTELAYAVWIILVHSTTQYPGFLGVFRNALEAFQQFNRHAVVEFVNSEILQRLTEVVFVLLGRAWGVAHPEVGAILGIAIGATIGLYMDDFIAMVVAAVFFRRSLRPYGIAVRDCFRVGFSWALAKECLKFGVKTGLPATFWTFVDWVALFLWLRYLPQYTTFVTMAWLASQFGSVIKAIELKLGGAIAESYGNGKPALARYYLSQCWRYTGLLQWLLVGIVLLVLLVLEPVLLGAGLASYALAVPFVIPQVVRDLQQPYNNYASNVLAGANHPNWLFFSHLLEAGLALIFDLLFIVVLRLPQTYGLGAVAWLIPCAPLPAILIKIGVNYAYIHRRVFTLRLPLWQAFGAPGVAALAGVGVGYGVYRLTFVPLLPTSLVLAVLPLLVYCIVIFPFFLFIPLASYLGAWDDASLTIFRVVLTISGPSKPLVAWIYRASTWAARHSPLHGRFGVDATAPLREARELMAVKARSLAGPGALEDAPGG